MRALSYVGVIGFILGIGGVAGAIETDEGWVASLILLSVGLLSLWICARAGEFDEDDEDDHRGGMSNDASYPSCLRR